MANFMTDFKPTGGDWLSAIAKILGSGSEYAGSMEKRKQEELFRKALMDYGVKSGELDTAEEQGLSERDLSTPTTTRMQSIKFGERIPSKEEMMRNQGGVDPASVKLQYPTSIEAPFETPEQSQNRLAGLASNKYEGNTSDQLMKLMALKKLNEPKPVSRGSGSFQLPIKIKTALDYVMNIQKTPGKVDDLDTVSRKFYMDSLKTIEDYGILNKGTSNVQASEFDQQIQSADDMQFEDYLKVKDKKFYNTYYPLYRSGSSKSEQYRTPEEKEAIKQWLNRKASF